LLLLAALLSIIPAGRAQDKATALPAAFGEQVEQRVIALTNEFRGTGGLQPLESEAHLTDAARYFAAHLAGSGKLEHDADGTTPAERVKKRGYNYCAVAENLASEFNSAGFTPETLSRNVVQGWRDSPTHRANMLHPDVTQIGVGVARSTKDGEYYVVQVFGRPMSQMVRFRVTNRSNAMVRYDYRKRPVALAAKQTRMHESCVAGDLKLDAPGQDVAVRPRDGGRYAIVEAGRGAYRLNEE
jgi:uncharacterized protein YkwD